MKKLLLVFGVLFLVSTAGYASHDMAGNDSDYPEVKSMSNV